MEYKISVIIPAYNSEKTLPETLDSILRQSIYNDIQLIIVNDGSTDTTSAIAKKYAEKSANIKVITTQNGGVSAARNTGIVAAEGKYTLFLDADDLYKEETALENVFAKMEKTGADFGVFRFMSFGFGGAEYNVVAESLAACDSIKTNDRRLIWNYLICNKCFRTVHLKESGVFFPPTCYCEDGAFLISYLVTGTPVITGIEGASAKYRKMSPFKGSQVTQTINLKKVCDFEKSADMIIDAVKKNYKFDDIEEYFNEIYLKAAGTALNEFYRKLHLFDDETLVKVGEVYRKYHSRLTGAALEKLKYADMTEPVFDRKKLAENPLISVRVKHPTAEFAASLKCQNTPQFEVLSDDKNIFSGFSNLNEGKPKSSTVVTFDGDEDLDPRLLSGILKLKARFSQMPAGILKKIAENYLKNKDSKCK